MEGTALGKKNVKKIEDNKSSSAIHPTFFLSKSYFFVWHAYSFCKENFPW